MGKILVIEPDHETRVSIRRLLEKSGHQVASATTVANAMNLLAEEVSLQLILLSNRLSNPEPFLRCLQKSGSSIDILQIEHPVDEKALLQELNSRFQQNSDKES